MTLAVTTWLGVDVGGRRKGFDVALVDERRLLRLEGRLSREQVAALVEAERPEVVGIDSPRGCAPDGQTARACERELARSVCGIRWTPDAETVRASDYYAWVVEGLALYGALAGQGSQVIEVFPTASWTRWLGKRQGTRAVWTRGGLRGLDLRGVPASTNQDQRDAIAAAVTAREHGQGSTEHFGEIVVPKTRSARRGRTGPRRRAGGPAAPARQPA
jgi:predicted nuclease with RNAse H fold